MIDAFRRLYNPIWRRKQKAKHALNSEISIGKEMTFEFDISSKYSHDWFLPRYADGSFHEPSLTSLLTEELSDDDIFFDIGAHVGYFAGVAAGICRQVHAFEMNASLIETIHRNVELNNTDGEKFVICAAITEQSGHIVGFEEAIPNNCSTAMVSDQKMVSVSTISLDRYCKISDKYPEVIKIDVEGHELEVLEGAKQTLLRPTTETVMIEVHPRKLADDGQNISEITHILDSAGFSIEVLNHRTDKDTPTPPSNLSERNEPFYIIGR
jgi:FkbM family methyltransferase